MSSSRATSAEVQKNFGRYQDEARRHPVTVTRHGRPSVVIVAADEFERLRRRDRRSLAVEELSNADIAAIRRARIPKSKRYRLTDIKT
ncbi:type II toxin-antitoxin system prevent-host-death family antitoxin [Vineibacter terrae]|uniref:type II toxin-antitoxin system prevent-host-death family antitoxin n=1 Tax=Vineibacter terrae TaxID=2586908 RepID=UPI002E371F40|nr:type II toxin-antitoxin system prevent-host-death family antitoxin [Vineibacter terrae]HEX2886722.1 type II toxin-antitoxin system prevent-host-death family antitoxin [Vineibacter terrae]